MRTYFQFMLLLAFLSLSGGVPSSLADAIQVEDMPIISADHAEHGLRTEETEVAERLANKASVAAIDEQHQAEYADDADVFLRPGLIAHRKEKWIRIWGEALDMNRFDPLEFLLLAEESGHGYEALAVSFARPLHIYEALEFIGMEPGRPINYDQLQMWPKGERVLMTYEWTDPDDEDKTHRARVEELVVDVRTKTHLAVDGLAFVGSQLLPGESADDKKVLAADAYDPHSIASDYNEQYTLFDIPRKVLDGDVYSFQRVNPDLRLPAGQLLEILIEPEYKTGKKRIKDLLMKVSTAEPGLIHELNDLTFLLLDSSGEPVKRGVKLKHFLSAVSKLTKKGHDPFLTVEPSSDLAVDSVQKLYSFLASIATDDGVRLEPPVEGHLFYRAFLPDEKFRQRETRPSQPWELYLEESDGGVTGRLVQITEIWDPEKDYPELKTEDIPLSTPQDLREALDERGPGVPVVLVYCKGDFRYGSLTDFIRPALTTHGTIYVFMVEDEPDADSSAE